MAEPRDVRAAMPALRAIAAGAAGARLVVLFGSVARGGASADSDVDVGISGLAFWEGLRLGHALGAALGREAHVVELDTASELLRAEVARDGLPLHEGEPDAWALFRADAIVRWLDLAPLVALCAEGARQRLMRESRRG